MLVKSKIIAEQQGLKEGYRLVINEGPNGQQTVDHIHIHLVGGRQFNWPPG
jgi:histidine triad (HIT) family protein